MLLTLLFHFSFSSSLDRRQEACCQEGRFVNGHQDQEARCQEGKCLHIALTDVGAARSSWSPSRSLSLLARIGDSGRWPAETKQCSASSLLLALVIASQSQPSDGRTSRRDRCRMIGWHCRLLRSHVACTPTLIVPTPPFVWLGSLEHSRLTLLLANPLLPSNPRWRSPPPRRLPPRRHKRALSRLLSCCSCSCPPIPFLLCVRRERWSPLVGTVVERPSPSSCTLCHGFSLVARCTGCLSLRAGPSRLVFPVCTTLALVLVFCPSRLLFSPTRSGRRCCRVVVSFAGHADAAGTHPLALYVRPCLDLVPTLCLSPFLFLVLMVSSFSTQTRVCVCVKVGG